MEPIVQFTVHHYHHFEPFDLLAAIQRIEALVSKLSDAFAALNTTIDTTTASADAAIARVTTDVAALTGHVTTLTDQITSLQAEVAAGGDTPENLQLIADLQAKVAVLQQKLDGLDPTKPVVLPAG